MNVMPDLSEGKVMADVLVRIYIYIYKYIDRIYVYSVILNAYDIDTFQLLSE